MRAVKTPVTTAAITWDMGLPCLAREIKPGFAERGVEVLDGMRGLTAARARRRGVAPALAWAGCARCGVRRSRGGLGRPVENGRFLLRRLRGKLAVATGTRPGRRGALGPEDGRADVTATGARGYGTV